MVDHQWLVPHDEVQLPEGSPAEDYLDLRPELIEFISYPYEWAFSQLQDAALLTLDVQELALARGMVLKDASAYNVQFRRGRPVLIDTLSFETYVDGTPWQAYGQFCRHFLAPLALMSGRDVRLGQLSRIHLDGIPLDLASRLSPWRSYLRLGLLLHLHLHAWSVRRYARRSGNAPAPAKPRVDKRSLLAILGSLRSTVRRLKWRPERSEWIDYYVGGHNYEPATLGYKADQVVAYLRLVRPARVWDLGANLGLFSRLAAREGAQTVAFDVDPACVERHYLELRRDQEGRVLPLLLDLTNPSPSIGWSNRERPSLLDRGHPDMALALGLVHHLAISNNVPLEVVASFLSSLAPHLVVEFVPKTDSQVRRMLATREDVFPGYHRAGFEAAFGQHFTIERCHPLPESERVLYLMRRREPDRPRH
jgi:ribosomal protein L11 methylase PrmA